MKQPDHVWTQYARLHATSSRTRGGPEVFHRAVEMLVVEQHITEGDAYARLVRSAGEAGTSVREAATAIVEGSLQRH